MSASDSETQGLTYTEAMAAKTQVVAKGNAYLDPLFDDLSLGLTYPSNDDFAQSLITYAKEKHPTNEAILKEKLFEISSVAFGQNVERLYEKIISTYVEVPEEELAENEEDEDGLSSLRIFRK